MQVDGKALKVGIQTSPERESKRRHFWTAADALRTVAKEDVDFILTPSGLGIHDAKELEPLGTTTEEGFKWDYVYLKKAIPGIDIMMLKKAMLGRQRRG